MQHRMQHTTKTDWNEFIFTPARATWNGLQPLSGARVAPTCTQTSTVVQHHQAQPSQDEILLQEVQATLDEARALMRRQFGPTVETVLAVLEEIDKFSSDFAHNGVSPDEVSFDEFLEVAGAKC